MHFGYTNILRICNRPFASVEEMDAALIDNRNSAVGRSDEVYILGDITMKPAETAHGYISALNGRKYLIRGNHDRFLQKYERYLSDFEWVEDYHVLRHEGRKLILMHYPLLEWDGYFRGAIHLHGHTHKLDAFPARSDPDALAFNVGVDCNGYRPVSISEVLAMSDAKTKPTLVN
jgi:calcineurin-like phosphoesterase family protein